MICVDQYLKYLASYESSRTIFFKTFHKHPLTQPLSIFLLVNHLCCCRIVVVCFSHVAAFTLAYRPPARPGHVLSDCPSINAITSRLYVYQCYDRKRCKLEPFVSL